MKTSIILAVLLSALAAPCRAATEFLLYRDGQRLHFVADSGAWKIKPDVPRLPGEAWGSSLEIYDGRRGFELFYTLCADEAPDWRFFDLLQQPNGAVQVKTWFTYSLKCDERREFRERWFCDLDAALGNPTVRVVLGSLLRRLKQPPRILDVAEIRQVLYSSPVKLPPPGDSVQSHLDYDLASCRLPRFHASGSLLLAIDALSDGSRGK